MNPPLPHDPKAEAALLGAVLADPETLAELPPMTATDFYDHRNRWIWDAVQVVAADNRRPDLISVTHELDRQAQLEEVGGVAYLTALLGAPSSSVYGPDYARLVLRDADRRKLLEHATELAKSAYADTDPAEVARQTTAALETITRSRETPVISTAADAVSTWYDQFAQFVTNGQIAGLTTGFSDIDRATHGVKRGELTILAGRPSMGKTSLAAPMSFRQARSGLRVGVFTLEESREAWTETYVLSHLGVDAYHTTDDTLGRVVAQLDDVGRPPMAFYEKGFSTMSQIESAARMMARSLDGLDVLWVDHLGYIDHTDTRDRKPANLPFLIGQTTKRLAALAKEFDAAVVALCQLSRVSAVNHAEPQLTDLRDSGELEQDARQVWFIHRPGYYADPEPPADKPQEARLLVRKNHNGPTGMIRLMFVKTQRRFVEVAR